LLASNVALGLFGSSLAKNSSTFLRIAMFISSWISIIRLHL
jgi:hypothetical protein